MLKENFLQSAFLHENKLICPENRPWPSRFQSCCNQTLTSKVYLWSLISFQLITRLDLILILDKLFYSTIYETVSRKPWQSWLQTGRLITDTCAAKRNTSLFHFHYQRGDDHFCANVKNPPWRKGVIQFLWKLEEHMCRTHSSSSMIDDETLWLCQKMYL